MKIKNYELLVAIAGDEPKPLLQYGHEGRTFVEGKPGTEFCFVFRNNSSDRVLVVPSLDGLSCMDGNPATGDSEGYVVEPYRRVVIKGWRTSLEKSAAFTFERKKDGYVKAVGGDTENVGIIGAIVYKEKVSEPAESEVWRRLRQVGESVGGIGGSCDNSASIMMNQSVGSGGSGGTIQAMNMSVVRQAKNTKAVETAAKFNLATGWGEVRKDEVREVQFARGELDAEFAIYYTDRKALKEMGIDLNAMKKPAVTKLPQAFTRVFCKPPTK